MQKREPVSRGASRRRARYMRSVQRYRILSIVAFCMFLVLMVLYIGTIIFQNHNDNQQDKLRDLYHGQMAWMPGSFLFPSASAEEPESDIPEHFMSLWEINHDLIGWILAGDAVDEPVVYRDNEFYMDHSFYKSYSVSGTVFADEENQAWDTDLYVILYGHNMRNDTMFGKLDRYRDPEYMKQNSIVTFDTIADGQQEQYVPFAVFDASMKKKDSNYFYLRRFETWRSGDAEQIQAFLEEIVGRSRLEIPIDVTPEDRILALVTCSYDDPDGRLMLFCRALREGETAEGVQAQMQACAKR